MNKLISIGLMTYNHENYIESCIKGLLSQNYSNMELIILDDASEDATNDIIDSYYAALKEKFVKIIILRNKKNCGNISHNSNRLMKEATGEFYLEQAGDDILIDGAIDYMMNAAEAHIDQSVFYFNMIRIDDDFLWGDLYDSKKLYCTNLSEGIQDNLFMKLMLSNCIPAPTVLLKRDIIDLYGMHDENAIFEDYEYWVRLSLKTNFYYIERPVVLYRYSETSLTNYNTDQVEKKLKTAMESDYYVKNKYINFLDKYDQTICWKSYYRSYLQLCKNTNYENGLVWIKEKFSLSSYDIEMILSENQKNRDQLLLWKSNIEYCSKCLIEKITNSGISTIAIYGYSQLAKLIEEELNRNQIKICYVIDEKTNFRDKSGNMYSLNDKLPKVDAVLIVPIILSDNIYELIKERLNSYVFELYKVLGKQ